MKKPVIVIAEAGVNHNGSIEKAKELIHVAAKAGVDYVKFQTFKADKLVSKDAEQAEYQKRNIGDEDVSQYNMLKKLELSEKDHFELKEYAESKNVKFLSTGFDERSIDFLFNLDIDLFKIPSGEITNKPYLEHIGLKGKNVVVSTGMANIQEISQAIQVLKSVGLRNEQITVLHCNTEYPTPMEDVNLRAMLHIKREFGVSIGYSDHTLGIEVPIAAVALGAVLIEKHFTLSRDLPGPDHRASLEPDELKHMMSSIRNIEKAVGGDGEKKPSMSEQKNRAIARKSIHINKEMEIGESISKNDLVMLRPGDGISPMEIDQVIGKKLVEQTIKGTKLKWDLIK